MLGSGHELNIYTRLCSPVASERHASLLLRTAMTRPDHPLPALSNKPSLTKPPPFVNEQTFVNEAPPLR